MIVVTRKKEGGAGERRKLTAFPASVTRSIHKKSRKVRDKKSKTDEQVTIVCPVRVRRDIDRGGQG